MVRGICGGISHREPVRHSLGGRAGACRHTVTEADNVRPFDPVIYYRYGRGALEQGDIVTAYLSFRTVFFCMGPYYDSYDRMKELESDSAVQELLTKRKDLEILSLSNRQDRFSDKMKEMKEMEEEDAPSRSGQEDDGLYSPEEVEGLREKAQEDQDLRAMWAQARAFQDNQEGTWHGMYEDFGYTGDSFEPKGAGTYETSWESNREDSDQPKFVRRTRSDEASEGIVIRDFYPASTASWFVQNVFTLADFKEEKGRLKLQVGIRNGPYRMRATFKYVRGEEVDEFGKATWELAAVRIGREKLDESPTAEDLALFRVPKKSDKKGAKKSKEDAATSAPLTGAADRVSTEELQTSYEIATLACAGSVTVEGPKTIPEAQLTGLNRQILLKWNVPSVPGIAWDGKDRMLPAMMCSAGRIFKWPGEELEMLSMYTSGSEDP